MLEPIITKARRNLDEARQWLSAESAEALRLVCNDIVVLNDFITKELDALAANTTLDEGGKRAARRSVFERAGRKLEVIKAKREYQEVIEPPVAKPQDNAAEEAGALLRFLREKEVRDRLYGMPEAQILSHFGKSLYDGSNPLLSDAILNAPAGFEPVSDAILTKIRQARAKKYTLHRAGESENDQTLGAVIWELFGLVKKELDRHRHKELPATLIQSKASKQPPFKF